MTESHFDAIVVGTGFGGAVMAYRLAAAGKRVCVLERGQPFAPGSFPRTPYQMAKNFWAPKNNLYGMFQFWQFKRLFALVASGLGGGSLIYANVLIRKDENWFYNDYPGGRTEEWPVNRRQLDPHYDAVEAVIGVNEYPHHLREATPKAREYAAAAARAGLQHRYLPLAVSFAGPAAHPGDPIDKDNLHGQTRYSCRLCGECDVGCNYGSKNSLDYNYLSRARRHGAYILTGADVRKFRPRAGGGWEVEFLQHCFDDDHAAPSPRNTISCDKLVLAAGALGSTHLMLRNLATLPARPNNLGAKFCGNGDMLGLAVSARNGDGQPRVIDANKGPVITGGVRLPDLRDGGGNEPGAYIEDAGIPVFLSWLAESYGGMGKLRLAWNFVRTALQRALHIKPNDLNADLARMLGNNTLSMSTLPMLAMGRDVPDGNLYLKGDQLECTWNMKTSRAFFDRVSDSMKTLAEQLGASFQHNPLWWTKQLITVHPLGGCPMGRTENEGVVDEFGQVFNNPGLYIADGSVMPGPVGPNPSLTIAALSDRFATRMLETWKGSGT